LREMLGGGAKDLGKGTSPGRLRKKGKKEGNKNRGSVPKKGGSE